MAKDAGTRCNVSGYSLSIGKIKKAVAIMKDELGWKFITEFVAMTTKMYTHRKTGKQKRPYLRWQ